MNDLIYIFAVLVLLAAVLASISIWSPSKVWVKACAVGATALLMGIAYVGFLDLLSKPKPVRMEWAMRTVQEAQLLGSMTSEGEAIYVWLRVRGVSEPRAYVMPWSRIVAQQLQEAIQEARDSRNGVRIRRPFRHQLEADEPVFYAPARQPPAPKRATGSGPLIYRQDG